MPCVTFVQTSEKDQSGHEKNSCLICGRTQEAHLPPDPPPIAIYFQGRLWKFNNWDDARAWGFYLID